MRKTNLLMLLAVALVLSGCSAFGKVLNPFYESPSKIAMKGEASDSAINGSAMKDDTARAALEQAGTYQRAHTPSPDKPVMQPAVVRLMWVPDHVNRNGDLVPSHYYYLKVLKERWSVQDAYELESQLDQRNNNVASSIPFVGDGEIDNR